MKIGLMSMWIRWKLQKRWLLRSLLNARPVLLPCNRHHGGLPALPVSFVARSLHLTHPADYHGRVGGFSLANE